MNALQAETLCTVDLDITGVELKLAARKLAWAKAALVLRPLVGDLEALGATCKFDVTYTDDHQLQANLAGDKQALLDFFKTVRKLGYQHESPPPKPGASSWSATFKAPRLPPLSFYFTSLVCRRVQVGTKKVEVDQPIYETQCGDPIELPVVEGPQATPAVTFDDDIPF